MMIEKMIKLQHKHAADCKLVCPTRAMFDKTGDYEIRVIERDFGEKLTRSERTRFSLKVDEVEALTKKGFEVDNNPKTWGGAVNLRILKQEIKNKGFSANFPFGSPNTPRITGVEVFSL